MSNKCSFFVQNLLFNSQCLLCSSPTLTGSNICSDCEQDLPDIHSPCRRCSTPIQANMTGLCRTCQQARVFIDSSHIPFKYETPIKQLIHEFKFNANLISGKTLADLFINSLSNKFHNKQDYPKALIPVPLHRSQVRQRGFNQSLFIAKHISKKTGIPVLNRHIKKTRNTAAQHELSGSQRIKNLDNAFAMSKPISLQHVAIVDDVVTTTTTVNKIAEILKQHDVVRVEAWALARTTV